jgi:hypothetical protein
MSEAAETKAAQKENLVRLTTADLKSRAEGGDTDAGHTIKKIVGAFQGWKDAVESRKRTLRECKDRQEAEFASFTNTVEEPLKASASKGEIRAKLDAVEMGWQELTEVRAKNIEEKKESAETLKLCVDKLGRAIEEASQLSLPGVDD